MEDFINILIEYIDVIKITALLPFLFEFLELTGSIWCQEHRFGRCRCFPIIGTKVPGEDTIDSLRCGSDDGVYRFIHCGSDDGVHRFIGICPRVILDCHCKILMFKDSQGSKRRGQFELVFLPLRICLAVTCLNVFIKHEGRAKMQDRSECKYILAAILGVCFWMVGFMVMGICRQMLGLWGFVLSSIQ